MLEWRFGMPNQKTKYNIFPDRIYIIEYKEDDMVIEVSGEEILAALKQTQISESNADL